MRVSLLIVILAIVACFAQAQYGGIFDSLVPTKTFEIAPKLTANVNDAAKYVRLAAASYCVVYNTKALENWTCSACKDSGVKVTDITRIRNDATDGNGYVGYSKNLFGGERIIISFLGSRSLTNWYHNFDYTAVNYSSCSGCKVHRGFLNTYMSMRPTLLNAVSKLVAKYPKASITVTGHSLGGALATHAMADLAAGSLKHHNVMGQDFYTTGNEDYDGEINDGMFQAIGADTTEQFVALANQHQSFGQPRVGNDAFAKWFTKHFGGKHLRHVHGADPVPHVPLKAMGFLHGPQEVWWRSGKNTPTMCSATDGEDMKCSNSELAFNAVEHLTYIGYRMKQEQPACT